VNGERGQVAGRLPAARPWSDVLSCLALLGITCAVFARVLSADFIEYYDDEGYVTANPNVAGGLSLAALRWSLTAFAEGNWHPVTWWSHLLDVQLFGMNPAGHHATSLAIHVANGLLVFVLLTRLTSERGKSFLAAALFAVHPLRVESVAWIAERKDVLSALFALCALQAYVSFARSRRPLPYLLACLLFTLSLMSKAMYVTLPLLLLLLDFWPLGRIGRTPLRGLLWEKIPLLLLAVSAAAVAISAQGASEALVGAGRNPLSQSIPAALSAVSIYVGQIAYPHDLTILYPYVAVAAGQAAAAAAVLAAATAGAWVLRLRAPWLLLGWSWFVVALVPVIGLVRVGSQAHADRYTYLPSLGVFVMVIWWVGAWARRAGANRLATAGVAVLCIAGYGVPARRQAGYWQDGFTLYGHALEVSPADNVSHNNLGLMLLRRQRYREAIPHLLATTKLDPGYPNAYRDLGDAYAAIGDETAARQALQMAIALRPDVDVTYLRLAESLARGWDSGRALLVVREGLAHNPASGLLRDAEARLLGK
jgi:hypothetical protein